MAFKIITSAKNAKHVLIDGYRMKWNRGPQGPMDTTYFFCAEKSCKATLALVGDLEGDPEVKYHRIDKHNHPPDNSANIVSATLSEFRSTVSENPDCAAKTLFEDLKTAALDSVETPNKLDLAKKLPTYRTGKL